MITDVTSSECHPLRTTIEHTSGRNSSLVRICNIFLSRFRSAGVSALVTMVPLDIFHAGTSDLPRTSGTDLSVGVYLWFPLSSRGGPRTINRGGKRPVVRPKE